MNTLDLIKNRRVRLLVFREAMTALSAALVICALVWGVYRSRVYFTFAAAAAGALLTARAWFIYCRWKDSKALGRKKPGVPFMLRGRKPVRGRKPAFLMTDEDFDDDLTGATSAAAEDLEPDQAWGAKVFSGLLAGLMLFLISFVP